MDILFANSYVRNKELAKEIYRHYYFHRKLFVALDILVMLSFLANLIVAIFQSTYNWTGFAFPLLFFLFQFYCYSSQVNTMVRRDAEVHGKEITVETVVTSEYIKNTASTGAVNKLEFEKVRRAAQTKNLILLRSKANLIYIFRKDSFTIGTKDDFIAFLKEKGIRVS